MADAREALRVLTQAGEAAGIQPDPEYTREIAIEKQKWNDLLAQRGSTCITPGEDINQGHLGNHTQ